MKIVIVSLATIFFLVGTLNAQQPGSSHDSDPQLINFEDMVYPPIARVARIEGVVVVQAQLDQAGNVQAVIALSGPNPLVPDCLSNAKKWKFKPNSQKSAIIVYEFTLDEGACHDASHSLFRLRYANFASITACAPVIGG